eukprot:7048491-Alexandrium_andersonii.AAC.1
MPFVPPTGAVPAAVLPAALAVVEVLADVLGAQLVQLAAVVHVGPLCVGTVALHIRRLELVH